MIFNFFTTENIFFAKFHLVFSLEIASTQWAYYDFHVDKKLPNRHFEIEKLNFLGKNFVHMPALCEVGTSAHNVYHE